MSTTIDSRVVEMRFDNKHFENNVQTTMSTLEKLKQKLNLSGASKGLENVGVAAKKVDFSGMNNAMDTVHSKFSAMEVIGVTALANITNSAVNAGKRIVSALTIDPIRSGFQEYETQINAVQTILANTSHNGTTIDQVNEALDQLNKYADQTIYNFTEMTRNIGTFTAAGVDLDTSVSAIQGIANLAAVSGSTSQQASTAMYQLSQALAAGRVSLMDWNSVVNAGMGGKVFQDALIRTSEVMGTGAQAAIDKYGSFRESLTQGEWLTTDVLTETLNQFTMAAKEGSKEWNNFKKELKDKGYTEEQAEAILKMANTATDAATKVKTFTQLWDVLKESAQSGWAQTWKILIGDFEDAKSLLTPIADMLTGFINKMSDWRNNILKIAMDSPFAKIAEKIKSVTTATEKVVEATKKYDKIVDRVISGEFGTGQSRWDKLAEAGYNWAKVQNLVNEKLGSSVKHNEELAEAQKKTGETQEKTNETQATTIKQLAKMSDSQLKAIGFTNDEVKAFRDLEEQAEAAGYSLEEVIADTDKLSGRSLLIDSFTNIFKEGLVPALKLAKIAWVELFHDNASNESIIQKYADGLYNAIAALHKFTEKFSIVERTLEDGTIILNENGKKLQRTIKGIVALFHIVSAVATGGLSIAFKLLGKILGALDIDILSVTASIGDFLVKIHDFIFENKLVTGVVETIATCITKTISKIREWINAFLEIPKVKESLDKLSDVWHDFVKMVSALSFDDVLAGGKKLIKTVKGWIDAFLKLPQVKKAVDGMKSALSEMFGLGEWTIQGFVDGVKSAAVKAFTTFIDFAQKVIQTVCDIFGIASPSKVMMTIGAFLVLGLLAGISNTQSELVNSIKEVGINVITKLKDVFTKGFDALQDIDLSAVTDKIKDIFSNLGGFIKGAVGKISEVLGGLDWGAIFTVVSITGLLLIGKKIGDALDAIASPLEGLSNVFEETQKVLKSFSLGVKAAAIMTIAKAIAILAGSIAILAVLPYGKVWSSVGAIGALALVIGGLTFVVGKFGPKEAADLGKFSLVLLSVSGSILILAGALKLMSTMTSDQMKAGVGGLAAIVIAMGVLMAATKLIDRGTLSDLGITLLMMAGSMLLMVKVAKQAAELDPGAAIRGGLAIIAFGGMMAGLILITKLVSKDISHVGSTLLKMSLSLMLMMTVVKIASKMDPEDVVRGGLAVTAFSILMAKFAIITRLATGKNKKIASSMLSMSISIGLMAVVVKIAAKMDESEILKGVICIGMFELLIAGLMVITRLASPNELKGVGKTIIAMSLSIGIMAGVAALLSLIKTESLIKGITAVGLLAGLVSMMVFATRGASDCKGNLIVMTVAIGLLAISVAALSQISPEKLIPATAALSILMGMFAVMSKSATHVQGAWKTTLMMTLVIGALAGVLIVLDKLNVESSLEVAGALSMLMLSFAGAMTILSKMSTIVSPALTQTAITMGLILLELAVVIGVLGSMKLGSTLEIATSLSMMLLAFSASMVILSHMSPFVNPALVQTALVMSLVVAALGTVIAVMAKMNLGSTLEIAASLSLLLLSLSGACAILAIAGIGASAAVAAIPSLILVILGIGAFVAAIGALTTAFPKLEEFLNKGIPVLNKVAQAIGGFVGNLVGSLIGGIGEGMMSSLPGIADSIKTFVDKMVEVSDTAATINESGVTGVANIVKMVGMIAAANWMNKLGSIFGETNVDKFTAQLKTFAKGIGEFASELKKQGVDAETMEAAGNAGTAIAKLYNALPKTGGWMQTIFGESGDIGAFATDIARFGNAIAGFSAAVDGKVKKSVVEDAANAGIAVAKLYEYLPKESGWMQTIFGEQTNFETFKTDLAAFGEAIVSFSSAVDGKVKKSAVKAAASAGTMMAKLYESLPKSDGWMQEIFGETTNLETFGSQLKKFGQALVDFSGIVAGGKDSAGLNSKAVEAANNAGVMMTKLQKAIPEDKWFDGKMSLDDFGKKIKSFGESIKKYSDKVAEINVEKIESSNSAAKTLVDISKRAANIDEDNIEKFKKVKSIGTTIKGYSDKVKDIDNSAVKTSVSAVGKMVTAIQKMAGLDTSGVSSFKSAINSLADTNFDAFIDSFNKAADSLVTVGSDMIKAIVQGINSQQDSISTSANNLLDGFVSGVSSKSKDVKRITFDMLLVMSKTIRDQQRTFNSLGSALMKEFVGGLSSSSRTIKTAVSSPISAAVTTIRNKRQSFYNAGLYLVEGFASGISKNTWKAEAKAKAMADAAEKAAKEALDINSPSKVFRALGYSVPEGFAMGIERLGTLVKSSSVGMTDTAFNSVKKGLSSISDLVSGDMAVQPTIRPVLDLSDVKSGAGMIGNLFNLNPAIGLATNASAINSMMNRRIQNGGSEEVVNAIDRMRKDLGKTGNTSYTINGLSYDGESEIADAIKTIIRVAKLEGRV